MNVGAYLVSRAVTSQVPSARASLTSVFGMGTGGPSPSSAPTIYESVKLRLIYNLKLLSKNETYSQMVTRAGFEPTLTA